MSLTSVMDQEGGLPARGPRAADGRPLRDSALVLENDPGPAPPSFDGSGDERREAVEAALGANLLHNTDAGVHDHNPQEERIRGSPNRLAVPYRAEEGAEGVARDGNPAALTAASMRAACAPSARAGGALSVSTRAVILTTFSAMWNAQRPVDCTLLAQIVYY